MSIIKCMDNTEFKTIISALADWIIATDENLPKQGRRAKKSSDEDNPTVPILVTNIKHKPELCPDCDRICDQGRRLEIKLYKSAKKRAWRRRCVDCNKVQDPYTGKYTLVGSNTTIKWNKFMADNLDSKTGLDQCQGDK